MNWVYIEYTVKLGFTRAARSPSSLDQKDSDHGWEWHNLERYIKGQYSPTTIQIWELGCHKVRFQYGLCYDSKFDVTEEGFVCTITEPRASRLVDTIQDIVNEAQAEFGNEHPAFWYSFQHSETKCPLADTKDVPGALEKYWKERRLSLERKRRWDPWIVTAVVVVMILFSLGMAYAAWEIGYRAYIPCTVGVVCWWLSSYRAYVQWRRSAVHNPSHMADKLYSEKHV